VNISVKTNPLKNKADISSQKPCKGGRRRWMEKIHPAEKQSSAKR